MPDPNKPYTFQIPEYQAQDESNGLGTINKEQVDIPNVVYKSLLNLGFKENEIGDFNTFYDGMANKERREKLFGNLLSRGVSPELLGGSFDVFDSKFSNYYEGERVSRKKELQEQLTKQRRELDASIEAHNANRPQPNESVQIWDNSTWTSQQPKQEPAQADGGKFTWKPQASPSNDNPNNATRFSNADEIGIWSNKAYDQRVAQDYLEKAQRTLDVKKSDGLLSSLVNGTFSNLIGDQVSLGYNKTFRAERVEELAKKQQSGQRLNNEEQGVLDSYLTAIEARMVADPNNAYRWGEILSDMFPFLATIALTRGIGTTISSGTASATANTLTNILSKKAATSFFGKVASQGLGIFTEGVALSPTLASTWEDYFTRKAGEFARNKAGNAESIKGTSEEEVAALYKAFAGGASEFWGERIGEPLGKVLNMYGGNSIRKYIGSKITPKLFRLTQTPSGLNQFVGTFKKHIAYDGMVSEIAEEYFTAATKGIATGEWEDWNYQTTWKGFMDVAVPTALMAGAFKAAELPGRGYYKYSTNRAFSKADKGLSSVQNQDFANAVRSMGANVNGLQGWGEQLSQMFDQYQIDTPEERDAAMTYLGRVLQKAQMEGLVKTQDQNASINILSKAEQQTMQLRHQDGNVYRALDEDGNVMYVVDGDMQQPPSAENPYVYIDQSGKKQIAGSNRIVSIDGFSTQEYIDLLRGDMQNAYTATVQAEEQAQVQQATMQEAAKVLSSLKQGSRVVIDGKAGEVSDLTKPEQGIKVSFDDGGVDMITPERYQDIAPEESEQGNETVGTSGTNGTNPAIQQTGSATSATNATPSQGQSTQQTIIPKNKKGEIEYEKIQDPQTYAQALQQEFGNESENVLDELIAEQEQALQTAKETGNAIERRRKAAIINTQLEKLRKVKSTYQPKPNAGQPTTIASGATEQASDIPNTGTTDSPSQDVRGYTEPIERGGGTEEGNQGVETPQAGQDSQTEKPEPKDVGTDRESGVIDLTPKPKRSRQLSPNSRTYKALDREPQSAEESLLQYFIGGGSYKSELYIKHTGFQPNSREVRTLRFSGLITQDGKSEEQISGNIELFGLDDQGAMDLTNLIIETLNSYPSKGAMLSRIEFLQGTYANSEAEQAQRENNFGYTDQEISEREAIEMQRIADEEAEYNEILLNEYATVGIIDDNIVNFIASLTTEEYEELRQIDGELERQARYYAEGRANNEDSPEARNEQVGVSPQVGRLYQPESPKPPTEPIDLVSNIEIKAEENKVNTDPTDAQKEAGNYKMGHVKVQGFDITIENPKGSVRSGTDQDGERWEITMNNTYGYFKRSEAIDGDNVDVFIGDNPESGNIFVVDQIDPKSKKFDEHKVMLGFNSLEEAQKAYLSNYSEGWQGLGAITEMSLPDFKEWLNDEEKTKEPVAYKQDKDNTGKLEDMMNSSWYAKFERAKSENDITALNTLYDKVRVVLNGIAQSKGEETVRLFEKLKKEMEDYASELKSKQPKPTEPIDLLNKIESEPSPNQKAEAEAQARKERMDAINTELGKLKTSLGKKEREASTIDAAIKKAASDNQVNLSGATNRETEGKLDFGDSRQVESEATKRLRKVETDIKGIKASIEKLQSEYDSLNIDGKNPQASIDFGEEKTPSQPGPVEPPSEVTGQRGEKQPWEMTRGEIVSNPYYKKGDTQLHKKAVQQALSEGKPVPPEVLAEYPELSKPQPKSNIDKLKDVLGMEEKPTSQNKNIPILKGSVVDFGETVPANMLEKAKTIDPTAYEFDGKIVFGDNSFAQKFTDSITDKDPQPQQAEPVQEQLELEIETDQAEIQKLRNSLAEGELILRTGKINGRKMGSDELAAVKNSVDKTKKRLGEKIEDYGEKIEGARKDTIKKYFDKINLNGRILSVIFPKPDYKALLESGMSVKDVAGIKVAYEFAVDDKKRGENVIKFYAAYAKSILAESINLEFKNNNYVFTDYGKSQVTLRTGAYESVAEKLGKEYLSLDLTKVRIKEMEAKDIERLVNKENSGKYRVQYYVNAAKYFNSLEDAINEFVEQVQKNTTTDTVVYKHKIGIFHSRYSSKDNYIGYQPKGKNFIKLKDGFANANDAFAYKKEHEAELQVELQRILDEQKQDTKRQSVRLKYTNETSRDRVGKDWRNGRDISSKEFAETFGFRGVEFGNWVNQAERQVFMNNSFDSLMDLAQMLNIPPKAISLSGELGITFGSRGSGQAAAHYEPGRRIINLTKTQGLGSLAHEWFHGVDNYFAGFKSSLSGMEAATNQQYKDDVRPEIKKAFDTIYNVLRSGEFKKRSRNLDSKLSKNYFSLPHEMAARAFENYVLSRLNESGQINDFIVNYTSDKDWNGDVEMYPYPKTGESETINAAFQQFFDTIQTKVDDQGNTPMFSRQVSEIGFYSTVEDALDSITQHKGTPEQFKAMLLKNGAKQAELDWMGWDDFVASVQNDKFEDNVNTVSIQKKAVGEKTKYSVIVDGELTQSFFDEAEAEKYAKRWDKKDKSITKADVQNWIDQNRIEIKEVVKGDKESDATLEINQNAKGEYYVYNVARGKRVSQYYTRWQDAADYLNENKSKPENTTKYSQYVEPGGSNYKELLLTMPVEPSFQKNAAKQYFDQVKKVNEYKKSTFPREKGEDIVDYTNRVRESLSKDEIYQALTKEEDRLGDIYNSISNKSGEKFKSSHFDEPNIVAHVRMNDRFIGGQKVLFVEEIQSDFSQAVRAGKTTAQTPFAKTDQWVNLALRRIMRYAVENGYDRIAWTNGEQQAARYDLSKQIDKAYYNPKTKEFGYFIKGNTYPNVYPKTEPEKIEDYLGKDLTKKLLDTPIDKFDTHELKGDNLKVGGEGMKAFYDQIITAQANKVGKPFGAKVESVVLGAYANEYQGVPISEVLKYSEQVGKEKLFVVQSLPVTDKMRTESPKGLPMFAKLMHGSPHKFDRFSTEYMGTGEGAQAYGWGLYFTDKKGIAEEYARLNERTADISKSERNRLAKGKIYEVQAAIQGSPTIEELRYEVNKWGKVIENWSDGERKRKGLSEIEELKKYIEVAVVRNLYTVKIHGDKSIDELNFLRWDKPIGSAINGKILNSLSDTDNIEFSLRENIYSNGESVYRKLSSLLGSDESASLFLLRVGIDGIQYPSEFQSKGTHEESFNYVVFDENAIEIDEHVMFDQPGLMPSVPTMQEIDNAMLSTVESAQKAIDMLASMSKNQVPVKVCETYQDVIGEMVNDNSTKQEIQYASDNMGMFSAIYVPSTGKVFMIHKFIKRFGDLARVWIHEVGVHGGMRRMLTYAEQELLMLNVYDSISQKDMTKFLIQYTGYENYPKAMQAEEYLAKMSMSMVERGAFDPYNTYTHDQLRALTLQKTPYTKEQLERIITTFVFKIYNDGQGTRTANTNTDNRPQDRDAYVSAAIRARVFGISSLSQNNAATRGYKSNSGQAQSLRPVYDLMGKIEAKNATNKLYEAKEEPTGFIQPTARETDGRYSRRTTRGIQSIEDIKPFEEWEKAQFPEYEKTINDLLDRVYNKKEYPTPEELSDAYFMFRQFKKHDHLSSGFSQNSLKALTSLLVKRGIMKYTVGIMNDDAIDKYDEIFANGFSVAENSSEYIPETITVDGKERPTRNNKGQLIHPTLEGIKNFWRWFGDSKVVDEQGRPLVVHHGTKIKIGKKPFTKFKVGELGIHLGNEKQAKNKTIIFHWKDLKTGDVLPDKEYGYMYELYAKILDPVHSFTDIKNWNDVESLKKEFSYIEDVEYFKFPDEFVNYWKNQGVDGVYYPNWGEGYGFSWIAFSPTQIKSATGNNGSFNNNNPSILMSALPNQQPETLSKGDKLRELAQDKDISILRLTETIKERGGKTPWWADPYNENNKLSSKSNYDASTTFERKLFRPLLQSIAAIVKTGKTQQQVETYMKAKHSLERHNSGTKAIGKDGTDWDLKTVTNIIKAFEQDVPKALVDDLWGKTSKATWYSIKKLYESGIMPIKVYEELEKKHNGEWAHYVPLRAWKFEEGQDPNDLFNYLSDETTFVSATTEAKGRQSQAEDPLAYIQSMAMSAIAQGNKNKVKLALFDLVRQNLTMKDLFRVEKVYLIKDAAGNWNEYPYSDDTTKDLLEKRKKIEEQIEQYKAAKKAEKDPANKQTIQDEIDFLESKIEIKTSIDRSGRLRKTNEQQGEHLVYVYDNGVKYSIWVSNPEVARAINNKSWDDNTQAVMQWFQQYPGSVNRWLTQNFTGKNPAFIPVNWIRDVGYASVSHMVRQDGELRYFVKNMPKAFGAIHRHLKDKQSIVDSQDVALFMQGGRIDFNGFVQHFGDTKALDTLYDLFRREGGETGYIHLEELKRLQSNINKEVKREAGINTITDKAWRKVGVDYLGFALDYMATESENSTRFATFLAALEAGKTVAEAATEAKNISVNFNRKGRITGFTNSLFAFSNVALQGGQNLFSMAKRNPKRFAIAAGAFAAAGFLLSEMLMVAGGDDDEYKKLPDYVRHNNIVLPNFIGKGYVTIPLPPGFRNIWAIGVIGSDMLHGQKTASEGAFRALTNLPEAFSPFSLGESEYKQGKFPFRLLTPTVLTPVRDIIVNEDFTGKRVYKEPFTQEAKKYTPQYQLAGYKTNPFLVRMSKFLNKAAGGDENRPASIGFDKETGRVYEKEGLSRFAANMADFNPSKVEHLFEYYIGGRGKFWNQLYKTGEASINPENDVKAYNMPIVNRLYTQPYSVGNYEKYAEVRNDVEIFKHYYNNVMNSENPDPQEVMSINSNTEMMELVPLFDMYDGLIKAYSDQIEMEQSPEMRKQLKERRDEIMAELTKQADNINKKYNK